MKRLAGFSLGLFLAIALLVFQQGVPVSLRWLPSQCEGPPPSWFPNFLHLAKGLGFPGFQIAFRDQNGRLGHCSAGWAELWPLAEPMRHDHRLAYASLSKILTSIVVMQLVQEKKLALDDRLVRVLSLDFHFLKDHRVGDITIMHLLSHRSGFDRAISRDVMILPDPWCPARLETLSVVELDHAPGEMYAYSNIGYCLLGAVIEHVEGKSFDRVVNERLLKSPTVSGIFLSKYGALNDGDARPFFDEIENGDSLRYLPWDAMKATGSWSGSAKQFRNLLMEAFDINGNISSSDVWDFRRQILKPVSGCDATIWRNCHGFSFYAQKQKNERWMYWRDGSLPGASSFAAIFSTGEVVVFLGNYRKADWKPQIDQIGKFFAGRL